MSRVFLANEVSFDRKVVLKVLPAELAGAVMLDRFRREIQLAAKLQHPHILPVFTAGEVNGLPYFTMPFVNGESLRRQLGEAGRLTVGDTVRILREVASALAYAHQCGVVHRDIKPDNILLSHGSAMVMDFGVAKAIHAAIRPTEDALTSEGFVIGTPAYMSPEQAAGDLEVDQRSDIYALGIMAYEMLAGSTPFAGRARHAMLAAHLVEKPEPIGARRPDIPDPLATLVMYCLEKEARDRPQNSAELVSAFDSGNFSGETAAAKRRARREPSIAVLPFANLSADPENEYFSDGITDEIISALSNIASLRVAARTSSFALKGRGLNVSQIAVELKVDAVLEGSVRRAKNRVRIDAQLVNAADGYLLFAERYDRELDDVFAIQEEIARSIVGKLEVKLTGEQKESLGRRLTDNVEAYEHYLRGRFIWNGTRKMQVAMQHFGEALRHDPGYALAYHGLADCYSVIGLYGSVASRAVIPRAKAAAVRGVELAPDLAETGTSLGHVQILEWDWRGAESTLREVIANHPRHALAHSFHAWVLSDMARPSEAKAAARRAYEIDPLAPVVNGVTALVHYHAREYGDAISHCERVLELDPMSFIGLFAISLSYAHEGQYPKAISYAREGVRLSPDVTFMQALLGVVYAISGNVADAQDIVAKLKAKARTDYVAPVLLSWIYAHLGEIDRAFESLDQAFAEKSCMLAFGIRSPMYDPLRLDPRFDALIAKLGLS
jgi:TolB-like protein/Tfp pilus assembly protein PilF